MDHPEYSLQDCERANVDPDELAEKVRSHEWEPYREAEVVYLRYGAEFRRGPSTQRCRRCGLCVTSAGIPSPPPPGCDERVAASVLSS